MLGFIAAHELFHFGEELVAIFHAAHINEVNDDEASDVA